MSEVQPVLVVSPVTTPGSTCDEERCLTVPSTYKQRPSKNSSGNNDGFKRRWEKVPWWSLVPLVMVIVSIVQVLVFLLTDAQTNRQLRFEPSQRWQLWRMLTYMLLHYGRMHLSLNVVIQCLVAAPLEVEQGGARTIAVYLGGGVFGALGACLLQPQPMVGASAGVYALLISHLAHLYLNFNNLKYRKYRIFSVCVLALSDLAFYAFHAKTANHPPISLGAHASGGVAGALFGLVVYKKTEDDTKAFKKCVKLFAFVVILILFILAIVAMAMLPIEFFVR